MEPDAVAAHEDWPTLSGGLLANGSQKRYCAASIAANEKWSFARRVLYAAGMVLTPGLHLWRLAASLAPRPRLWGRFLLALPVSITVYCYAAVCEAAGYLFGPGSSEADFVDVELKMSRKHS